MDLIREAQATDPEADALLALLEALSDRFGREDFGAAEVVRAIELQGDNGLSGQRRGPIETAIIDIAVRPYDLLRLAREGAVRPTLASVNEGCSESRASSQEDEP